MAMANNETQCFEEHQQNLNEELNHIINDYDEFKQIMNEQKQNPLNHSLIKQISQWEIKSIQRIQKKAQDCRDILIQNSQTFLNDIEMKFNDLSERIKQIRQENEFNEISLNYLRNQLKAMTQEFNNPSNISIQHNSQSFINEISITISKKSKFNKEKQNAITVAAGKRKGRKLNQLNFPYGIFIDEEKNIFIADHDNHRIVKWKYFAREGQIIAGENGQGSRMNQLNNPTDVVVDQQNHSIVIADSGNKRVIQWLNQNHQILIENIDCFGLAIDKYGFLYVSDYKKNEVRRWKMGEYNNEGIVVAGGNGQGNQRKDVEEGRIVAGGNGQGRNLNQLSLPQGVIVDYLGQIYVADCENHRVMRWCEGKVEGEIVVGGNGKGNKSNQLNLPFGLSFDDEGNLYVAELGNHRIKKSQIFCE
ncbi:unnamed protein product [Adineta steineri]|uniref:NHL repeat containing protein n=1 Tax=Adineta steineri TaxID=433720 RepID=A0A814KIL3_9BILA|nr:unnamed protein product [Adineta steineri]CAF1275723.1 unnamed protein product [Adineta steineri]